MKHDHETTLNLTIEVLEKVLNSEPIMDNDISYLIVALENLKADLVIDTKKSRADTGDPMILPFKSRNRQTFTDFPPSAA